MEPSKNRKIRVLHLLTMAVEAGTELIVYELMRHGKGGRLEQSVAFLLGSGPMSERFEALGSGEVVHLDWDRKGNKAYAVMNLRNLMKRGGYDLVIAYGLRANLLARAAGIGLKTQAAGGLRSIYSSDTAAKWHDPADRVTFGLCAGYISNSQAAIDRYAQLGFNKKKLYLVYDGVDTDRFAPGKHDRAGIRKELGFGERTVMFACVANLRPVKNHLLQIEAMRRLVERGMDAALVLVGDGSNREEIERAANEIPGGRVKVLGRRSDVETILAGADAFVLSSHWEGIPDSMLEAMATGLPIVTTDVGCIREALTDGEEGFLVRAGDAGELTEKMARLAEDVELRRAMGTKGRAHAVERFSLGRMMESFIACCETMTGGEKTSG